MRIEWKSNVSDLMSNIAQEFQNQIEDHNPKGMLWVKSRATDTEKFFSQCKPKNPVRSKPHKFQKPEYKICTLLENI